MSQLLVAMLAARPRGGSRAADVRTRCETRTRCHRRVRKARVARSRPMKGWARAQTVVNENVTAYPCQSPPPATSPGLRMALYTYNFGNYRNELGRYDSTCVTGSKGTYLPIDPQKPTRCGRPGGACVAFRSRNCTSRELPCRVGGREPRFPAFKSTGSPEWQGLDSSTHSGNPPPSVMSNPNLFARRYRQAGT